MGVEYFDKISQVITDIPYITFVCNLEQHLEEKKKKKKKRERNYD